DARRRSGDQRDFSFEPHVRFSLSGSATLSHSQRHDRIVGYGIVAEAHAPDDALREIVDVALVVRLHINVETDGLLAHRLHGVDVGRAVDVTGSAVERVPYHREAKRAPRHLPVAREAEVTALHARPAQLALVAVDRRAAPARPAQHKELHGGVLEYEVARVATACVPDIGLDGCRLDQ